LQAFESRIRHWWNDLRVSGGDAALQTLGQELV